MPRQYPTDSQRRTLWSALTGVAIVVLGTLAVGFVYLLGNVLNYLQPVLVPVAVAGILAYLLNPLVEKMVEKGVTRLRSIIYVFCLATLLCALAAALIVPKLVIETGKLIEKREEIVQNVARDLRTTPWLYPLINKALNQHPDFQEEEANPEPIAIVDPAPPTTVEEAQTQFDESEFGQWLTDFPLWAKGKTEASDRPAIPFSQTNLGVWLSQNWRTIWETGKTWLNASAGKIFGFVGYALGFLLVPVYLFFFLKETATIKRRWSHFVPLKESNFKREVVATLTEMNDYLIAFFRGQVLVSIIDGVLTGILLWIIGLPYAFVIGMALAILGVMPFIGFLLTLIPALLIAAAESQSWQYPLLVFGIFFIVQQIDGIFIQPKIIGDKVGLHAMTIIFSIFFWSLILGGFLGALLAVPLTASVKVLFTRYIWDPASLDEEPPPDDTRSEPPPTPA